MPIRYTDFYKTDHRRQFPEGTETVYSNFTARSSRIDAIQSVVLFGLQGFIIKYLMNDFYLNFFSKRREDVVRVYKRRLDHALGPDAVPMDHIEALHYLGYLPLRIKALPEGTLVPVQVPMLTVENTHPDFAWLTNFIETMLSASLWGPCTSATIALEYRRVFEEYAAVTGADRTFCKWQGHDFSFRGMFGIEAAQMSGAAHLLSFTGTDTIPAIDYLEEYYGADCTRELIGGSVPATEHAVMCAGGDEEASIRRLLTEVYPKGIVSVVCDTWDFWRVVTDVLPRLRDVILAREGKLVIRPDSGDPVEIIVGVPGGKGLVDCLWESFGGTVNAKGFRELDPHVGVIYGDSITLARQTAILSGLESRRFASSSVVLGIGSFTYQYVTRDTFGFAMKATHCTVRGESREIFKAPKTDGAKNSHRGLLAVYRDSGRLLGVNQSASRFEEQNKNLLETVFEDGKLVRETTLAEIRERIDSLM